MMGGDVKHSFKEWEFEEKAFYCTDTLRLSEEKYTLRETNNKAKNTK